MALSTQQRSARHYAKHRERILEEKRQWGCDPANKAKAREYNLETYAKAKSILDEARSRPCVDCGITLPPECMDLDHVRGEKLFGLCVSYAKGRSEKKIRAEIAKCEPRCPTCHRLRHYNESAKMEGNVR